MRSPLAAALTITFLVSSVAGAEDKVPAAMDQEILIKASLLTLNDANVTGNYAVLHAKLSEAVSRAVQRRQTEAVIQEICRQQGRLGSQAVAMPPIATKVFAHRRTRRAHSARLFRRRCKARCLRTDFIPSEGEWKPINLERPRWNVQRKEIVSQPPSKGNSHVDNRIRSTPTSKASRAGARCSR